MQIRILIDMTLLIWLVERGLRAEDCLIEVELIGALQKLMLLMLGCLTR